MDEYSKRTKVSKVFCEKCNCVFDSKEKFDEHIVQHSPSAICCESCPIDMAIEKIKSFFKKDK